MLQEYHAVSVIKGMDNSPYSGRALPVQYILPSQCGASVYLHWWGWGVGMLIPVFSTTDIGPVCYLC